MVKTYQLKTQHVLLAIAVVGAVSLCLTMYSLNCPPCSQNAQFQAFIVASHRDDQQPEHFIEQKFRVQVRTGDSAINPAQAQDKNVNGEPQNSAEKSRRPTAKDKRRPPTPQHFDENTPIEELCKGFREEQEERLRAMRESCEARVSRWAERQRTDPIFAQHGPARVYVHRNRSLMWCETPKAISTSWGRAVFALEGRDVSRDIYVWVHIFMQATFEYLAPVALTPKVFSHVPNFDAFQKLLFVRDPFSRFLSAYLDKVAFAELTYHNLVNSIKREMRCNYSAIESRCLQDAENATTRISRCQRLFKENGGPVVAESVGLRAILAAALGHEPEANEFDPAVCDKIPVPDCSTNRLLSSCNANLNSTPSFSEFTQYVLEARDPKFALDRHWSPIALNCAPCTFPFTRVLRFESATRDVECTLREIYPESAYERMKTFVQKQPHSNADSISNAQTISNASQTQRTLNQHNSGSNGSSGGLKHSRNSTSMVRALRPRGADYKRVSASAAHVMSDYYSQLSPELMQRLWKFYEADSELLEYSLPDFGLDKFKHLSREF